MARAIKRQVCWNDKDALEVPMLADSEIEHLFQEKEIFIVA